MHEVERWRGTPEQRARRGESRKLGQFAYFDRILGHPPWPRLKVLDFGGSDGSLLRNRDCTIRHENYSCLEVVRQAIEDGRAAFPRARWIHYDRYNCSFNPEGVRDLPVPDLGVAFDVILAYSVFTHTTRKEMHDLVSQLRRRLAPGGLLAFTFLDPRYGRNLQWKLNVHRALGHPDLDVDDLVRRARDASWCALVDGESLSIDDDGGRSGESSPCRTFDVFYTAGFLQREFPDAEVHIPTRGEAQHCCVIRREA